MSEQRTENLGGDRSFEERVFARFDAIDARFDTIDAWRDSVDRWRGSVDGWRDSIDGWRDSIDVWRSATDSRFDRIERRLGALELTSEKRATETKPIWERALSEILQVKSAVVELSRKVGILNREILTLKANQEEFDERLDKLESRPT